MDEFLSPHQVIFLGATNVGKTCLINRAITNDFSNTIIPTSACTQSYLEKTINDEVIKLQLVDTAGQEHYLQISGIFFRKAKAIVLAFDLNDRESLEVIDKYYAKIENEIDPDEILIYLVGCKHDLYLSTNKNSVQIQDAEIKAESINATFCCTSSKTGHNVDNLFNLIAQQLLDKYGSSINESTDKKQEIDITKNEKDEEQDNGKKCC